MDMSEHPQKELLKNAINEMLLEYDEGGDYAAGGFGGPGVSEEFFTDIFNAFIDPFRHTAAFIEKFSSEVQRMAGKLSEDVMALLLPGYKAEYEEYEKEHQERIGNIRDKYAKVFARTEAHLFTGDAALMGFLYAPHSYITGRLLKSTPDAALAMVDMFAGGNAEVKQMTDRIRDITGRMKHVGRMRGGPTSPRPIPIDVGGKKPVAEPTMRPNKLWNPKSQPKGQDLSRRFYGKTHTKSDKLSENFVNEGLKDIFGKIATALSGKKIVNAIEQSPLAKQMQADAEKYISDYVAGVVDMTRESLTNLKSTSMLDKATNGSFSKLIQQKGQDDAKKTAQLVVGSTKKGIKDLAIQELEKKMKQLPKAAAPLAKIYQSGIQQVKSL